MSKFTEAELEYLKTQRLGRLATVNERGEPQIAPVGFRYNAELDTIDIGGHNIAETQKFRNGACNGLASFVVDDVLPPWQPRWTLSRLCRRKAGVQVDGLAGDSRPREPLLDALTAGPGHRLSELGVPEQPVDGRGEVG